MNNSETRALAIHFANLGPYHLARLESAVEVLGPLGWRVVAFEIAGADENYGWSKNDGHVGFERVTVFPNAAFQRIGGGRLKKGISEALDSLKPTAMAIAGWGTPDARLCLRWCKRNGVKAIVMSETRAADGQRVWCREWFKSRIVRQFDAGLCGGESHRRYLVELGIPEECVALGYNVVDNEFFGQGVEHGAGSLERGKDADLTTIERQGGREKEQPKVGPKGEGVGKTESKDTECTEVEAGACLDEPSGASESDSLASELADSPVSESPPRFASGPASKLATSHSSPVTAPEALALDAGRWTLGAGLPARQPYFLASCRFIRRKNVERLIQAYYLYATLNKGEIWPLVLLGDGDLRGELIARARELGLMIVDSGPVEYASHSTGERGLRADGAQHCAGSLERGEAAVRPIADGEGRMAEGSKLVPSSTTGDELDSGRSSLDSFSVPGKVFFAGWRQIEELVGIYQRAGAFVHPALEEPWGLVINEAMAAGLPIFSSRNVGAAEELVREADNGFLFDPRDSYQIARYMGLISRLPRAEREAMGRKSREIVEAKAPKKAFGLGLKKLLSPNERR